LLSERRIYAAGKISVVPEELKELEIELQNGSGKHSIGFARTRTTAGAAGSFR
jgi:hypothetical protein